MWPEPARSRSTSRPSSAARTRLAADMARRRSSRSTRAPPGRPNSSHGRNANAVRPEMSTGLLVSEVASSGIEMRPTPSAQVVVADEANSCQNERSSEDGVVRRDKEIPPSETNGRFRSGGDRPPDGAETQDTTQVHRYRLRSLSDVDDPGRYPTGAARRAPRPRRRGPVPW